MNSPKLVDLQPNLQGVNIVINPNLLTSYYKYHFNYTHTPIAPAPPTRFFIQGGWLALHATGESFSQGQAVFLEVEVILLLGGSSKLVSG